jgi:coatomer protein complex subunit gamma
MDTLFDTESVFYLAALESKLVAYVKDPPAAQKPFDFASAPKISRAQEAQAARELFGFSFDLAAAEE